MAPIRTAKLGKEFRANAATPKRDRSKTKPKRRLVDNATPELGLQKLKSSLRSTKRLLAKENLAADIRMETERRLRALEADLARRQIAEKERSLAIRYHKIKFFERQKVLRKIRQASKSLSSSSTAVGLGNALFEARVDLNYIIHYPKTRKYISLFPPEVRHGTASSSQSNPHVLKTDREREEIRDWIRQSMARGELPMEPELLLDSTEKRPGSRGDGGTIKLGQGTLDPREVAPRKENNKSLPVKPVGVAESDDFFEESDDSNNESNGSDENIDDDKESDSDGTTSEESSS